MRYGNFCNAGRTSVNIGDYLQFLVTEYLFRRMGVPEDEVVYFGFRELETYRGEELCFPFCYSVIDFVKDGRIAISDRIRPVFLAVTLSTVDRFMDVDEFLEDGYNRQYLEHYGPIGCRDEMTHDMVRSHGIPAYINGCMTAVFPREEGPRGDRILFVDAPRALLPHLPEGFLERGEFSTQQYYFNEGEIADFRGMFRFVSGKYEHYKTVAQMAVTSRLHVALPLAAAGIPAILAKDYVDGRFSFIESYLPTYGKEDYGAIDWNAEARDWEPVKKLLLSHALGRIRKDVEEGSLRSMEEELTSFFQTRDKRGRYFPSHAVTHTNGERFDAYAKTYWKSNQRQRYGLWGASKNNLSYWRQHIASGYPKAELVALFDSFRTGDMEGIPYQHPEKILSSPADLCIIVCSVGAAQAARRLFRSSGFPEKRYCIVSDTFLAEEDARDEDLEVIE